MAEWSRVVNTTTHEYLKGAEENVLRNRKLLALMKSKGRISFDHGGDMLDWKVEYKQHPLEGYSDGQALSFARSSLYKTAQLEWRGYVVKDSMTKKERLMNRSAAQIIDIYAETTKLLMKSIDSQFGGEFYIDGNASGNEDRMHGIESFMGQSGVSAGAPVGTAVDTYATLLTTLTNYGGAWTGTWPSGTGDSQYDFWSPLLVDYTSAVAAGSGGWSSATKTWPNTGNEALRYAILYTQKNRTMDEQLDVFFLDTDLYRQWLDALDDKERILVSKDGPLLKLGFRDTLNLDGTDVTTEYGIPASTGYGFNADKMELMSLQKQLFVPEGPDWDIVTSSWRFKIDCLGNFQFNPRNFCKLKNYS